MIKVKVYSIATSGSECVLLLEEIDGPRLLPIWIGLAEGQAIAIKFADITLPRPMTHDLLLNTIENLDFKVDRVVISDLKGQTFYAQIHIAHNSTKHAIDSRPSDAVALAVRANCPIFVEDKIFEKCHSMSKPISEDEVKKFKDEVKGLKPEDIFKGLKEKKRRKKNDPTNADDEGPESSRETDA